MSLKNLVEPYNCYLVVLKLCIQNTNIIVQLFGTVLFKMYYSASSTKTRMDNIGRKNLGVSNNLVL